MLGSQHLMLFRPASCPHHQGPGALNLKRVAGRGGLEHFLRRSRRRHNITLHQIIPQRSPNATGTTIETFDFRAASNAAWAS